MCQDKKTHPTSTELQEPISNLKHPKSPLWIEPCAVTQFLQSCISPKNGFFEFGENVDTFHLSTHWINPHPNGRAISPIRLDRVFSTNLSRSRMSQTLSTNYYTSFE